MEKNIVTALLIVPTVSLTAYFIFNKYIKNIKLIINTFLTVQTLLTGALVYLLFKNHSEVLWGLNWGVNESFGLSLSLKTELNNVILYSYALLAVVSFYLFSNNKLIKSNFLVVALLSLSAFFMIASQNLFSMFYGFAICLFASIYAVGFGNTMLDKKANAFSSWIATRSIASGALIVSLAALSLNATQITFEEINAAKDMIPEWTKIIVLIALMVTSFCYPILSSFRAATFIGNQANLCFNYVTTLFVSLLIYKLSPLISSITHTEIISVVIAISAFIFSLTIMSETNGNVVGLITSSYTTMIILLGSVNSSANTSLSIIPTTLFSATLLGASSAFGSNAKYFTGLLAISLMHLPIFSGGLSLLETFKAVFEKIQSSNEANLYVNVFIFGITIVSYFFYIIGIVGFIKFQRSNKSETVQLAGTQKTVLVVAFICGLSVVSGLPVFSSFLNKVDLLWAQNFQWMSQMLGMSPETSEVQQKMAIVVLSIAIVGIIISSFGLYSNDNKAKNTRDVIDNVLRKLKLPTGGELAFNLVVWERIILPTMMLMAVGFEHLNKFIIFKAFELINAIYKKFQSNFEKIETIIFDKKIVGGVGNVFMSASKALRFLQTGQIQFYFGFGLIVFLAILYRLIVL